MTLIVPVAIYAIPKLHKNPIKFRFIAEAKFSSIKPLAVLLHYIPINFRNSFQNICKTFKYSNFNRGKY